MKPGGVEITLSLAGDVYHSPSQSMRVDYKIHSCNVEAINNYDVFKPDIRKLERHRGCLKTALSPKQYAGARENVK